jgi:hypothetical protein
MKIVASRDEEVLATAHQLDLIKVVFSLSTLLQLLSFSFASHSAV